MVQNHVGERTFPVRSESRLGVAVREHRASMPARARRRRLLAGGGCLAVGLAFSTSIQLPTLLAAMGQGREMFNRELFMFNGFIVAGFMFCAAFVYPILASRDGGAPMRAQQEYIKHAGRAELSLWQQQVLALDAVSDFGASTWNSSLAHVPLWRELPRALRAQHTKNGQQEDPWVGLHVFSEDSFRRGLDNTHRIANASELRMRVTEFFDSPPLSAKFVEIIADGGDDAHSRLAAVSGRPDVFLIASSRSTTALIGADIELIVQIVRLGYAAGYIDAPEAWEMLDRVGRIAFRRFSSYDEYWDNVELGVAFRSNSLEAVLEFRERRHELATSNWPATVTPWPARDHRPGGDAAHHTPAHGAAAAEEFCRLYMNTSPDRHAAHALLTRATDGTSWSQLLDMSVSAGDPNGNPGDFLSWPSIEIDPRPDIPHAPYTRAIRALIRALHAHGIASIPSCDFETELTDPEAHRADLV